VYSDFQQIYKTNNSFYINIATYIHKLRQLAKGILYQVHGF
jgi:hypothetical protein